MLRGLQIRSTNGDRKQSTDSRRDVRRDAEETQVAVGSGGTETAGHATNENYFYNDGSTFLLIRNSGSTQRNVEIVLQPMPDGETIPVKAYVLEDSEHFIAGPFPPGLYNDEVGVVHVNCDHAEIVYQAFSTGRT